MLTCVTDGALAAAYSCTFTGFCPGLAAHRRSFRPTDPHTSPRRAAADSTDSLHYYGPARKSSLFGHGDAPAPARFFRFPRGPSIYLAACKAKKKKGECGCFALSQVPREAQHAEVCLSKLRKLFLTVKDKNGLKFVGTDGIIPPAVEEIGYSVDRPVGSLKIKQKYYFSVW